MPDFVGLADLARCPDFVAEEVWRRLAGDGPLSIQLVDFPKPTGGVRPLAIVDPIDEIAMRVAVTPIVHQFQRTLLPEVYSGRLVKGGPGWFFRRPKTAWAHMRSDLKGRIRSPSFSSLLRTDVASFYPSISTSALHSLAQRMDPTGKYLSFVGPFLARWHGEGLDGVPIGPEVSFLLANSLLSPLDDAIATLGYHFARYTDDLLILNIDSRDQNAFLEIADTVLGGLGLARSGPKTEFTSSRSQAAGWVDDALIASASSALATGQLVGEGVTKQLYEAERRSAKPNPSRISYALKVFMNRGDPYAIDDLLDNRAIAAINPRVTGDYLNVFAKRRPSLLAGLPERIRSGNGADGTDAHLLRSAASRPWGRADGQVLLCVALDERTPEINRGWALQAWAESDDFDLSLAVDVALYSNDLLSRAACISLRKAPAKARCRAASHIRRIRPSIAHTCRWVRSEPARG